jgi:hypothetical protein
MSETISVAISSDFSSVPLSKLTIADIVKTLFRGGAILLLIRARFNPSEEEAVRDGWGAAGPLDNRRMCAWRNSLERLGTTLRRGG